MNATATTKPTFSWSPFYGGMTATCALIVAIITLMSWHEVRPHEGAVTQNQYRQDMSRLLEDVREIRLLLKDK